MAQLLIQKPLLGERGWGNIQRNTADTLTVRGTDHRIRAKRQFLRIRGKHDGCLHRLLCRLKAEECEPSLRDLHGEHVIELAVGVVIAILMRSAGS